MGGKENLQRANVRLLPNLSVDMVLSTAVSEQAGNAYDGGQRTVSPRLWNVNSRRNIRKIGENTLPAMANSSQLETSLIGKKPKNITYLRNTNREVVGSSAFNLEYDAPPTKRELKRDVISYLGEYRLQVQKYKYELIFGKDNMGVGPLALRDKDRGESMRIKARRTLEERTLKGQPIEREEAEEKGVQSLEDQVQFAQTGDRIFWGSPPGPKDEGYGEYGYLFSGVVSKLPNGEAKLLMEAIRVEKPKIGQYNEGLSALTGTEIRFEAAEDFLKQPVVVRQGVSDEMLDHVLKQSFSFSVDKGKQTTFEKVIKKMDPVIDEFIELFYRGTREEKIQAFRAMENYATALHKEYESLGEHGNIVYMDDYRKSPQLKQVVHAYNYKPEEVAGSCGDTKQMKSNNILSISTRRNINSIYGDQDGKSTESKWYVCPDPCGYEATGPIGDTCPSCGLTKEKAKENGMAVCE